jgi:peptidoglycan hydrolase-like protein with peptidoglycan-binding domain
MRTERPRVAALLKSPERTLTMQKLDGYELPVLRQGDSDEVIGGYHRIARAQSILAWLAGYAGKLDGDYGPQTAAAVKALGLNDGRTIDAEVWEKIYGLSRSE